MLKAKEKFGVLDATVISLIVERTKLNKEKYTLILAKTVIIYFVLLVLGIFVSIQNIVPKSVILVFFSLMTMFLIIVYIYVLEHYKNIDKDIGEVISLLQTKSLFSLEKKRQ